MIIIIIIIIIILLLLLLLFKKWQRDNKKIAHNNTLIPVIFPNKLSYILFKGHTCNNNERAE